MDGAPEIIGVNRLLIQGLVYVKSKSDGNRTYWDFYKVRREEGTGRATTVSTIERKVVVTKGPSHSAHTHPPNRKYAEAEKIKANLKQMAEDHPEKPSSGLL